VGVLLAACGGDDDEAVDTHAEQTDGESSAERGLGVPPGNSDEAALAPGSSWAASAKPELSEVAIYDSADAADPSQTLPNPDQYGTPLVFLVDGTDTSGPRVPVFLPVQPNGSTGWVNASDVTLQANPYRVTVELGAHKLTVANEGEVVVDTPVGVGRDGRETPTGLYYIKELLQPPDPDGDYGPYAYGISGFTNSPDAAAEFGDGGVIGIHGTNQPDVLGTDVSSGCIRVENAVISEMAGYLPLGTPVEIVA
jgi:lipoprotein-anchoring transpeptidase ErfK/SrfK